MEALEIYEKKTYDIDFPVQLFYELKDDPQIDYYMTQIFKECEEQQSAYKDNCKAYITQLLVYLCRNYMSDILSERISAQRITKLTLLNQVLLYIDEHYCYRAFSFQLFSAHKKHLLFMKFT